MTLSSLARVLSVLRFFRADACPLFPSAEASVAFVSVTTPSVDKLFDEVGLTIPAGIGLAYFAEIT